MATGTRLMQEISDQFLNCKICFESFREPKTLTCLHTFCLDCLQQQYEQEVSTRSTRFTMYTPRTVTCPLCRKKTELPAGGVRRLPDNFLVCNLNQVLAKRTVCKVPPCDICASVRGSNTPACGKCLDCAKLLCKGCYDLHLNTKVTQHHSLIDLEGEKDIVCKTHTDEIVKFYCEPCSTCICVVCTFQEHRDHDVLTLSDGYSKYRGDLESLLGRCETRAEEVRSRLDAIDKYETVVKDVRDRIRDLAINSIAKVRAKERELMKRVETVYGEDVQAFVDSRPQLQDRLDELQGACQLTGIMLRDKGMELLLIKQDIEGKMEQLLEPSLQDVPDNPAIYNIRFVPGDVVLGKLAFGDEDEEKSETDEDDVGKLKKKMQEADQVKQNGEAVVNGVGGHTSETIPVRNAPDVISNCTQTENCRTTETSTSMNTDVLENTDVLKNTAVVKSVATGPSEPENAPEESSSQKTEDVTDRAEARRKRREALEYSSVRSDARRLRALACIRSGQPDFTTSVMSSDRDLLKLTSTPSTPRAQRKAEREKITTAAVTSATSASLTTSAPTASTSASTSTASAAKPDRAPAPDIVPKDVTTTGSTSSINSSPNSISGSSSSLVNGSAFVYTPGRMIRSRKIQTEISALDVEAGSSNTDREFVQTMLQAEIIAEKMRQDREAALSPRLRDRPRRVRTADMGVNTTDVVRVVPPMVDKETRPEPVQHREIGAQVVSDHRAVDTQTAVVTTESLGTCTDREGQFDKSTGTQSVEVTDRETCTPAVNNETKGTLTDGVATSDRATGTMEIKMQHRAIGTVPLSTEVRACQFSPQTSAVSTNTPVVTSTEQETQAVPDIVNTATMPDRDIEAEYFANQAYSCENPQSSDQKVAVSTCDRASDAFPVETSNKCTLTQLIKLVSSSTETVPVKLVDRDVATTEVITVDQWTVTPAPTLVDTGVTPPRPDTLEVGVSTMVVLTDEQATSTDIKAFRDTQTETMMQVCDGETLTEPIGRADAQTSVDYHMESRQCETDEPDVMDETSMTDYYNPWEAVETTTEATQCDTAILKTKETNTVLLKLKAKETQTQTKTTDSSTCNGQGKDGDEATSSNQASKSFQDAGTMALSCNIYHHDPAEDGSQSNDLQHSDKSPRNSFDIPGHFLAQTLSREFHDVATSTDFLPFIGLLSDVTVDDLILVPGSASAVDSALFRDGIIMVDDETSTDFQPSVVDATTQTIGLEEEEEKTEPGIIDNDFVGKTGVTNSESRTAQSPLQVNSGVNTEPKVTFEKETCTVVEGQQVKPDMGIHGTKHDKGTSTLDHVRIVNVSGMGQKARSVDKITMTPTVERREIGVVTDAQQVDGKITECISKLKSVSERLTSPVATPPPKKKGNEDSGRESDVFFGKSFDNGCSRREINAEIDNKPQTSPNKVEPEKNRKKQVQNLLDETNAILKRKDISPIRKPQPLTSLKGRKPVEITPPSGQEPQHQTKLPLSASEIASPFVQAAIDGAEQEQDSSYSSKSLPRGFSASRRSGTVKMGNQALNPVTNANLPLSRYNSAPGRIATVPAQTLLRKTGGSGKMGRSPSPQQFSPTKIQLGKKNSPPEAIKVDVSQTAGNIKDTVAKYKITDCKTNESAVISTGVHVAKPQLRRNLPSITETRTPSSCSENSVTSQQSSGSPSSKRQSSGHKVPQASSGTTGSNKVSPPTSRSSTGVKVSSPTPLKKSSSETNATVVSPRTPRKQQQHSTSPTSGRSTTVVPKRQTNASAPSTSTSAGAKQQPQNTKDSNAAKAQGSTLAPTVRVNPASPLPSKRIVSKDARDPQKNLSVVTDTKRLSTQSSTGPSRSPSTSPALSTGGLDSASNAPPSPRPSPKQTLKISSSKLKNSSSTETIQSSTSASSDNNEGGAKPKKYSGISFMQRFLSKGSKKKKSDKSENKKEQVTVNKPQTSVNKTVCPPSPVTAMPTPTALVQALTKESYANVPMQHPPHHYVPHPEVKSQAPAQKPASYVYVQQRLISIQHDKADTTGGDKVAGKTSEHQKKIEPVPTCSGGSEKGGIKAKETHDKIETVLHEQGTNDKGVSKPKEAPKKTDSILVAYKQAMFADKGKEPMKLKDSPIESRGAISKNETAGVPRDAKGKDVDIATYTKSTKAGPSHQTNQGAKVSENISAAAQQQQQQHQQHQQQQKDEKGKHPKDGGKSKGKKSEVKSASSWIRGKGEKPSKK